MPERMLTVGNVAISLHALSPELDAAFDSLYSAAVLQTPFSPSELHSAAEGYLASVTGCIPHDEYFNNFTPLWLAHLNEGRHAIAEQVWHMALAPALHLEAKGVNVHKGTAYYFQGMTALLADALDRGYLLMHRGLQEDIRTHATSTPSTPGFAFVTLDADLQTQAFRPWVHKQATAIEARLSAYRAANNAALSLPALRQKFLAVASLHEPAYLYSYAMAQEARLRALPVEVWTGPFPAQIAFSVIFDLCLVVDAILHHKNTSQWKFIEHATYLASAAGLPVTLNDLRTINGLFSTGFQTTLQSCASGSLSLGTGQTVSGLAAALATTYGCRNRGAHNVSTVPLTQQLFDEVIQQINDTLFLAVEALY